MYLSRYGERRPLGRLINAMNGVKQCEYRGQVTLYDTVSMKFFDTGMRSIPLMYRIGNYVYYHHLWDLFGAWNVITDRIEYIGMIRFILCRTDGDVYKGLPGWDGFDIDNKFQIAPTKDNPYEVKLLLGGVLLERFIVPFQHHLAILDGHILTCLYFDDRYTIDLRAKNAERVKTLSILPVELQHHILLFLII